MTEKSKRINRAAKIGAAGVAGITAVLLAAKWAYGYAFKVDREKTCNPYQLIGKHSENYKDDIFQSIEKLEKLPCEWVSTRSQEGYKLAGRYYHQQDGAPLMIFFHGYRSPALRDFCGGFWIYREQGYNILVVDQRAHGRCQQNGTARRAQNNAKAEAEHQIPRQNGERREQRGFDGLFHGSPFRKA